MYKKEKNQVGFSAYLVFFVSNTFYYCANICCAKYLTMDKLTEFLQNKYINLNVFNFRANYFFLLSLH